MRTLRVATIFVLMCLSAACALQEASNAADRSNADNVPKCDIDAYIEKFQGDAERICIAEIVAKRCNEVDACQFRCQLSGEWDNVGGGCHHMCNYGDEFALPEGTEVCTKQDSTKENQLGLKPF